VAQLTDIFLTSLAVFPSHLRMKSSAPIDRPVLRESSPSPNLIGDRAAHPVCDHYLS